MKLNLKFPYYMDLVTMGLLPTDKRAHALWFFYTAAEQMRQTVGKGPESQIILDDMPWMDKRYEQLATSTATLYGLSSPDEWENFWPVIENAAIQMGYDAPSQEYRGRKRLIIH